MRTWKKEGVVACSGKPPLFPLPSYFVVSGAEEEGELGVEKKQQKHNISHIKQSPLFPHLIPQISATYFSNNPTFCIGVGRQEGQHQEERRPHLGKHSFFVQTLFFCLETHFPTTKKHKESNTQQSMSEKQRNNTLFWPSLSLFCFYHVFTWRYRPWDGNRELKHTFWCVWYPLSFATDSYSTEATRAPAFLHERRGGGGGESA